MAERGGGGELCLSFVGFDEVRICRETAITRSQGRAFSLYAACARWLMTPAEAWDGENRDEVVQNDVVLGAVVDERVDRGGAERSTRASPFDKPPADGKGSLGQHRHRV
jgi:hypothetical protein